jgi:hypothetical protein
MGFAVRMIMPSAFYAPLMMRSSVMMTVDAEKIGFVV